MRKWKGRGSITKYRSILFKEDIGRVVVFIKTDNDYNVINKQVGILKSFDNKKCIAFVAYNNAGEDDKYMNYTGAATKYEDLVFSNINIDKI